jgi:DnaJ-class molecular chaperone
MMLDHVDVRNDNGTITRIVLLADAPAKVECVVCNGIGEVGIPGAICDWCHGDGYYQRHDINDIVAK